MESHYRIFTSVSAGLLLLTIRRVNRTTGFIISGIPTHTIVRPIPVGRWWLTSDLIATPMPSSRDNVQGARRTYIYSLGLGRHMSCSDRQIWASAP